MRIGHLSAPHGPLDTYDQYVQTFTVGIAGTLSQVDVEAQHYFATSGSVVNLWGTIAGVPDPSVSLANWGIGDLNSPLTPSNILVSFDLGAAAFSVMPGQVYAIAFSPL